MRPPIDSCNQCYKYSSCVSVETSNSVSVDYYTLLYHGATRGNIGYLGINWDSQDLRNNPDRRTKTFTETEE